MRLNKERFVMRGGFIALAALVLLATSFGSASAQGGRRGMMGRGTGLALLRMETVQKELKMTQAQIDKLATKQQEVQGQMQDLLQSSGGFQNMSPEDRQKLMEKSQEIQHKAVADILTDAQMPRFDQLELQRMGVSALTRKDVVAKLKLTDDQVKQIGEIRQKSQEDMRAAYQGNPQEMTDADRQKRQEIQKEADGKIAAVLTADQQKQWKKMLGDPFDFGPPPGAPKSNA